MKRSFKIILLAAAVAIFALLAVACTSAESISLDGSDFQTVYVRGQELDLDAVLTVDTGKKITEVTLGSKGVSISGYDKNTVGKQTVTVEYGGASTEVTVTVVERLAVSGALTEYLVGDSLDRSKGAVKITGYDGKSRSLQLSSDAITVTGFDSASAGKGKTLRLVYTDGTEEIEGTLTYNIYDIESIDFHQPNRITYGSHYDGKVDASGGRFVLKGNGGAIRREVEITENMITGFDLGVVNAENPTETQTLTVTFRGEKYTYDVELTYTAISMFGDNAEAFNSVAWDGDTEPVIEESLGELALRLMGAYMDLPVTERELLDADTVFNVARAAMSYGFELWGKDIRQFKGVFAIEYGERVLYLESPERVAEVLPLFENKESALYTVAPLLLDMIELYSDRVLYENETTRIYFNSYPVMDTYDLTVMQAMLEHTLDVYDLVKDIPQDWRTAGLTDHYDALAQVSVKMLIESYVLEYAELYYLVSDWRGGDMFDIIYTYLYETDQTRMMSTMLAYGMPTRIGSIYTHLVTAILAADELSNAVYLDTTKLLYNYYKAKEIADTIRAELGTAENYVYLNAPVNVMFGMDSTTPLTFDEVIEFVRASVLEISEGLAEKQPHSDLLKEYLDLIDKVVTEPGYEDTKYYGDAIGSLLVHFAELEPVQQYDFLATVNMLYRNGIPSLSFDDSDPYSAYASLFNVMINDFMRSRFTEEAVVAYDNLILAIEVYLNRYDYPEWKADFTDRMAKVAAARKAMTGNDEVNFDSYLGRVFGIYNVILAELDRTVDLGDWADDFDELCAVLKDMQTASYYMSNGASVNYSYFLASYERALELADYIVSKAPNDVVEFYYREPCFEAYTDKDGNKVYWSCDYAIGAYRGDYAGTLLGFGANEVNIYDSYYACGLDEFLALYYGIVSDFVNRTEGNTPVFDKAEFVALLDAYRQLDSRSKALFATLEGGVDMYGAARELFLAESLTPTAAEALGKLFTLEAEYFSYEVSGSGVTLGSIRAILDELTSLHAGLVGDDKDSFAPFEDIYAYYVEKCAALFV